MTRQFCLHGLAAIRRRRISNIWARFAIGDRLQKPSVFTESLPSKAFSNALIVHGAPSVRLVHAGIVCRFAGPEPIALLYSMDSTYRSSASTSDWLSALVTPWTSVAPPLSMA
jgi:hypothetical protein